MRSFLLLLCCLMGCLQQKAPRELRIALRQEPATLDPRKGGDLISSQIHFLLFEGLMRLHADQSLSCAQAEKVLCSDDGLTYTFTLRETHWSNGERVLASDFERSWKTVLDPSFPSHNAHLFYPIRNAEKGKRGLCPLSEVGIHTLDDKTLAIHLERPTPYFLELISFSSFFPVHKTGDLNTCNGPFLLKEWRPQEELLLLKNPLYWDLEKERPDRILLPLIADERTALQLFEQGLLDLIGDPLSTLPVDAIPSLKEKWSISSRPMGATTVISFNVSKPPFHHPKIRKALTLAINRQALITHILQTDETPAQTLLSPFLQKGPPLFPDGDLPAALLLFDEGLDELGMTRETLPPLHYLYSTSDKNRQIAQAIQQQWREGLGLTVHLENREHKILIDTLAKRDYTLAQHVWIAQYHDPMSILERFQSKENVKNYSGWENAVYTHTLEASSSATSEERKHLLREAEALLAEEMPVCPLYHWEMHYIVRPGLQGAGELVMNTLN